MSLETPLDPTERRILGVLLEKELTTPDQYPLSVNAIVNGCNQKSNRDPLSSYHDFEVEGALRSLFLKHWATSTNQNGRVVKWKHRVSELLGLAPAERAVLAELLLRGSQQPGELRARAARMAPTLDALPPLMTVLQRLQDMVPPLVIGLGRRAGERADRFGHTLAPEDETPPVSVEPPPRPKPERASAATPGGPTLEALEARVEALERRIVDLEEHLRGPHPA